MEKVYAPHEIERRIYERWESNGWFAPQGDGAPLLHRHSAAQRNGHAAPGPCVSAHADGHAHALSPHARRRHAVAAGHRPRRHRDADGRGAPAQRRRARGAAISARDEFVERVWKWKEQSGGTMAAQMRRLGDSVDWSRDRFTMDAGLSRAVVEVFVRLHEEGLIYRGKRLVNWDPVLLTALSDLEVQSEQEEGQLWHLRYPLEDGSGHIVVATTRPETMFGDTAVAVNPDDERYKHLVGKKIRLPLADRLIPDRCRHVCRCGLRLRRRQDHARPRLQRLRDRRSATSSRRSTYSRRARR